eukprot:GSMAST32.ASY1.ANO1.2198.1 assembled CDS
MPSTNSAPTPIDKSLCSKLAPTLLSSPVRQLARNIVSNELSGDFQNLLINREARLRSNHVYSDVLSIEGKPTSQKSSGRCWMFAALNVMRLPMMKRHTYLFFYDKLERFNYVLEQILDTLDEPVDSRVLMHLLQAPLMDGGQWDMLANLVQKYGIVPKQAFPETLTSGASRRMNKLLTHKLRQFSMELRRSYQNGTAVPELRSEHKPKMIQTALNILLVFFGTPPAQFDWSFYDKSKKYRIFRDLTPQSFFEKCVPFRLNAQISLVHDPRNEYFKLYTVSRLGNVVGGNPIRYLNLPIDELKRYTAATILDGSPVWFGCDWGKHNNRPLSLMDPELLDIGLVFGNDAAPNVMTKRERLDYGESLMTHAMVFTGMDLAAPHTKPPQILSKDFQVTIKKWRVENSHGERGKGKGYMSMTDVWFNEFLYQVAIDKDRLTQELQDVVDSNELITLPPWDPLGALA